MLRPLPVCPTIMPTVTRIPRTQAWPPMTSGRCVMRFSCSMQCAHFTNTGEIQRPPVDVGRPSLAGNFARFCQRLFERHSLYSAALHICNSAPCLILPSAIY